METQMQCNQELTLVNKPIRRSSKFILLVEKIYNSDIDPRVSDGTIATMLWNEFALMSNTRNQWRRVTFKTLLIHFHNEGCYALLKNQLYLRVIANVSKFGLKMIRPVERWKRKSLTPEAQLEDCIAFCFARYPVPVFLITAFYGSSLSQMMWYVQLGAGRSVKTLPNFPEHLTAKMAHYFSNTPRGFDINQALIRAQALGHGATTDMADRLAWSRLSAMEGNTVFWGTVIQFLIRTAITNPNDIRLMLEYLEFMIGRNRNYTMKGRTAESLHNDASHWHERMQKMRNKANEVDWVISGIPPLHLIKDQDGKTIVYYTVELLTADDLYEEGEDMNHCIAEYTDDCIAGTSAVFSLRKNDGDSIKKLATIEIDPRTPRLTEAEGNCNTDLSLEAMSVLKTWCKQASIDLGDYDETASIEAERPPVQNLAPNPYQNLAEGYNAPLHRHVPRYRNRRPEPIRDIHPDIKITFWIIWMIIMLLKGCHSIAEHL